MRHVQYYNNSLLNPGDFVVQEEKIENVKEALEVLRDWNPQWKPKYFMCDFSEVEIQAIESCMYFVPNNNTKKYMEYKHLICKQI